jgi:hypothetical protein
MILDIIDIQHKFNTIYPDVRNLLYTNSINIDYALRINIRFAINYKSLDFLWRTTSEQISRQGVVDMWDYTRDIFWGNMVGNFNIPKNNDFTH